ncbi:MAG: TldD/PmbA family protein, partial [Proteocatella sp.]
QETYYESAESLNLSVYQGEVEKFNLSEQGGLSYRGIINGKMGYAFTESFDDAAIDMLVDEAYANAMVIESTDLVFLHDGSGVYVELTDEIAEDSHSVDDKIKFMVDLEKGLLESDERIVRMSSNAYSESIFTKHIKNTKGLDLKETRKMTYAYAIVVAKENDDTRTGIGVHMASGFSDLCMDEIIESATTDALGMLGAKSIVSLQCPVVFENKAFASFLSQFANHFSAEQVQKKLSALAGKLGTLIASEHVKITDNPHLKMGINTSAFDAEGIATYVKPIIEKGVLKTYLHNLKTAHIDGVKTTGNASKDSYKSSVEIAPSNLCFEPGLSDMKSMLKTIEKGVFITSLQGLHAGINRVSGDFSLQCHGYQIQQGFISEPVSQITVSGNFFELLKDIDCVADDFLASPLTGGTGSPSIRVKALSISGS